MSWGGDGGETALVQTLGMNRQCEAAPGPEKVGSHPFYVFGCCVAMINLLNPLVIILIWLEKKYFGQRQDVFVFISPHTTHTHKPVLKQMLLSSLCT